MNESKMSRPAADTQSLLQTRIRYLAVETQIRASSASVNKTETELLSQVRSRAVSWTCIFTKSLVANITLYSLLITLVRQIDASSGHAAQILLVKLATILM